VSVASAVAFLWRRGVQNWLRVQVKRLKNPRYLIAATVGVLYFYLLFLRRFQGPPSFDEIDPDGTREALRTLLEAALTAFAVLAVISSWIFGGSRALLQFTEAEVQYFFPAPLSRRAILHVRVLKTLLRTGISAAIMTALFRPGWGVRTAAVGLGAWLSFATLSLHSAGVSLLRESLLEHGRSGWRRWWLALLVAALAVGAVAYWAASAHPPPPVESLWGTAPGADGREQVLAAWTGWMNDLLGSPPLSYVLWPLRAPIRVMMAGGWLELLARLPAALLVLGGLYLWVISSSVAFEEAAVEAASERTRRLEARRLARAGVRIPRKVRSSRLPLPRRGPAWIALTWKNVIAARRLTGPALLVAVGALGVAVVAASGIGRPGNDAGVALPLTIAAGAAASAGFLALFGPISVTADLRQDMPMSDVLRTLPLHGWQVVLGEVLSSALLLAAGQWALWIVAAVAAWNQAVPGLEGGTRAAVVLSAMIFGPALSFAGLSVQNAGAIFFPAWVTVEGRLEGRGFEATGQRLLTMVGTLLVLVLALVPATLVGGMAAAAAWPLLDAWAAVVGSLFGAGVLVAECLLVVRLLGTVFERIDLTE